ncbi:site-specific integrase [Fictibacillus sp. S7]|uniref:site-specific integrase n=1 Tax=Fictibacillus sp. S7 TaxID=2212476 RepID=UPI001F51F137|nr:site-specific integrase [Fictibacillus sp. S7]
MSLQELQKLFSSLESNTSPRGIRNVLMFKLLATTGMRRQELVDLTWEQVDLVSQTIKIFGSPFILPLFRYL